MKKIFFLLFLINHWFIFSQEGWDYNSNDYEFSMTITAVVIDLYGNSNSNYRIGIFDDSNCVGNAYTSLYIEEEDANFAFLTIYSNTNYNEYDVVIYNSNDNLYINLGTLSFQANINIGSISNPYEFFIDINNLIMG